MSQRKRVKPKAKKRRPPRNRSAPLSRELMAAAAVAVIEGEGAAAARLRAALSPRDQLMVRRAVVAAGRTLLAVRDGGGYEDEGFVSFGEYCRVEWDLELEQAEAFIRAAERRTEGS